MKNKIKFIAILCFVSAFQSVNVWAGDSYSSRAEDEIKETLSVGLIPEDLQKQLHRSNNKRGILYSCCKYA